MERARWSSFLVGDPHTGAQLFEEKGCAHCHAVNGSGGKLAPDLGSERPPASGFDQLVTAMWNHAPRMWERMRQERVPHPDLGYEEMAHLFAFLYTARYVDAPGDAVRGRQLFEAKGCIRCHAFYGVGGKIGPDLSTVGADTPIAWTQTMWNHVPEMEAEVGKLGLAWPRFQGGEMNDLLAYVREMSSGPRHEFELLPADPDRGWQLFQSKSCIVCHAVKGEGGHVGPELGPRHDFPPTIIQFAGLMWNHSPQMWREMQARRIPRPTFAGREMADLIAFLHSVHYFEPGGSPKVGELLFGRRGCSNCHGPRRRHAAGTLTAQPRPNAHLAHARRSTLGARAQDVSARAAAWSSLAQLAGKRCRRPAGFPEQQSCGKMIGNRARRSTAMTAKSDCRPEDGRWPNDPVN